ncbi:TonB-dependent hemoglobin/transferrin/lactoferrin family receptor [Ancylobacter dichloromethanicus]|uniref:TonB-dependent hemoglobin/transferrin/lactoferrin family receptor n=1 Tax=Ancylobacter dichloromethanicus TaxID=518825 RepID=UPI001BCC6CF6|nr:TonB-dependent hemoglobin/transferrin/lactoferrin family receptor [Ancylobacter dichloromethanicus]MBS7553359.1 TonB-dependent hemoglobin/transferrin/lactoferrin family receptor [Ancylobacter dichloromethanicus]
MRKIDRGPRSPSTLARTAGWGVSWLALVAAVPAMAQEAAAPEATAAVVATDEFVELDPITVVATRTAESWIDTLAGVTVRRSAQLDMLMPSRTADLFEGMPGTTAIQNANTSQTQINIRGLQDFGRVAVIVDGARQNFNQLGHAGAGGFFIEPGLIADVDVVRGPVSNIYGSGAIGGVVTMRTKDADDIIAPGKSWGVEATGEAAGNGFMGYGSVLGAARVGENVDLFIGGTYRDADNYHDGNGDVVPDSGFDTWTGIAKATFRPADFHEIKLTALNYDTQFTTSADAGAATSYSTQATNRTVTASWNYENPEDNLFDWRSSVYWNQVDQDQVKVTGSSNPITGAVGDPRSFVIDTVGFDANNTSRFSAAGWNSAITFGGDYFQDEIDNTDDYGFGEGYNPSGDRGVGGAFVQWKGNYSTWLEAIAALRYDAYSLNSDDGGTSGERVSPKLTLGVTPWSWLTLYGTYAEGYRAPTVTEALVSGPHPLPFNTGGTMFYFLPNPGLQAEVGKNKEVGINIKKDDLFVAGDKLRAKFNYYQNDVDNYIELVEFGSSTGTICPIPGQPNTCFPYNWGVPGYAQYQNVQEARLKGFEFEGTYDARKWFLGVAGQISEGEITAGPSAGQPLSSIQPDQVSTTLGFRFLDEKLTVAVRWTAVAAVKASDLPVNSVFEPTDSFNLVSVYAGYQPNENMLWRLSVENLLDEQYTQYENFLPSAGLTVKGALTVRFGGGEVASISDPLYVK